MTTRARSTVPLALSTIVGLTAATLMFTLPGDAAPTPTSFAAEAKADVWKVHRLDLDMSGDPADVGLDVAAVQGLTGQAAAPDRSKAVAHNLDAGTAPAGRTSATSKATATQDTVGAVTAAGQAGTVPGVVDYGASTLTARGRWAGDTTCLDATAPLTQSRSVSQGSGIVPAAIPAGTPPIIPIPLPTELPTEIPTTPPTGFPTGLPTDLPTLPTDPPTTLPTLPTDLPTTLLPTLPTTLIPTLTIRPDTRVLPAAQGRRAEGDVSMVEVAPASVEQRTLLQEVSGSATVRRVYAETVGKVTTPGAPVAEFFGGEATLTMTGDPTLSAYSTGGTNGSQVTWTPPTMKLTVDGEDYAVPTDGSALALPYSQNEDVVLTVSAGTLSQAEAANGTLAQAVVSALHVLVKNGDSVALDAELFPMSVKALAPVGGIDCALHVDPPNLLLKGRNNGPRPDRLTVKAVAQAAGAKAILYRVVDGDRKRITAATLDARGDHGFKVKDKNGRRFTKYLVVVRKTELTSAGVARKRVR